MELLTLPVMAPNPSVSAVMELVQRNHQDAEDGHSRLRGDVRDIESRLDSMEKAHAALRHRFERLEMQPVDLDKLKIPPSMIATIIGVCLLVVGANYALDRGLKADIADISNRLTLQQQNDVSYQKLVEERSSGLRDAMSDIKKKQELQQIQIGELKDMILSEKGKKP